MFGIPLALFGVIHYGILTVVIIAIFASRKKVLKQWLVFQSMVGALFSVYFMYLQLVVLKSICLYCTLSALFSFTLVILVCFKYCKERLEMQLSLFAFLYQYFIKPIFFLIPAETIHEVMVKVGELLGKTFLKKIIASQHVITDSSLKQKLAGINFDNPIGLAAGFDYDAHLTQILYPLGFGFQTVGTITNHPYKGNPPPRLGRLPKSKSLMVNKGFKNLGAQKIAQQLKKINFKIPLGISIGLTNNKKITTIKEAVDDIVKTFKIFEKEKIKNSFYELNISCPNLINTKLSFYPPKNLTYLLSSISYLRILKPVFVKMPIEKTNREFSEMLNVIINYPFIKGIIIGNLQKNRKEPSFIPEEVKKFKVGNFSGKPCEQRSNELIKLTYKNYKNKLIIIGCGGIFNGSDAYKKIKLGASLVQLITGMIYQGPQLISQINLDLIELLKKDGFKNINQAIGHTLLGQTL